MSATLSARPPRPRRQSPLQLRRLLAGLAAVLLSGLLLLASPMTAVADRGPGKGAGMTADQAAERVRKQTGGRVLRVDAVADGFRVKVLTPSGEVREITVPSGRR
jgi:hypothetical protein